MNIDEPVVKKRGRKSKKEILEKAQEKEKEKEKEKEEEQEKENDNITVLIEEKNIISNDILNENLIILNNFSSDKVDDEIMVQEEDNKPCAKKRGRKPKGGKIIQQITPAINQKESKPSVILHLKCSLKDLQINTILGYTVEGYNFPQNSCDYSEILSNNLSQEKNTIQNNFFDSLETDTVFDYEDENKQTKENDIKEIWKKLKNLEHNLHINNISDKKSACFWCTFDFENPPIHIPKCYFKESYQVYGCFCSPECATAYLMNETIDTSTKFERYHLLNHIYSKIFNYQKNIKPAPNPFYMLNKFSGNLTIQEYRSLFKTDRLFLVVDKPLSRILPELHEDNEEFILSHKIIPSHQLLGRQKISKNMIMNEAFGLAS
jgi:hypothetical protein